MQMPGFKWRAVYPSKKHSLWQEISFVIVMKPWMWICSYYCRCMKNCWISYSKFSVFTSLKNILFILVQQWMVEEGVALWVYSLGARSFNVRLYCSQYFYLLLHSEDPSLLSSVLVVRRSVRDTGCIPANLVLLGQPSWECLSGRQESVMSCLGWPSCTSQCLS